MIVDINHNFDVIIIGCGAAGLRASISASDLGAKTVVIGSNMGATKRATADYTLSGIDLSNLSYKGGKSSRDDLANSIIFNSFGIANVAKARAYGEEAGICLKELIDWKVCPIQQISEDTVLIAGETISKVLYERALKNGVSFIHNWIAFDLFLQGDVVCGVKIYDILNYNIKIFSGKSVILATGGYNSIFKNSTLNIKNTPISHTWALNAGASLIDMEMINYCPLSAIQNEEISIFPYIMSHITQVHINGNNILEDTFGFQPHSIYKSEWDKLFYYISMISKDSDKLPNLLQTFEAKPNLVGILSKIWLGNKFNIIKSWSDLKLLCKIIMGNVIDVGIYPHYSSGGIMTNEIGETSVQGLFACGESAGGLFGAYRTASSITDCLVSGKLCGITAANRDVYSSNNKTINICFSTPDWDPLEIFHKLNSIIDQSLLLVRSKEKLNKGIELLMELKLSINYNNDLPPPYKAIYDRIICIEATLRSALERQDSRGFHIRTENRFLDPKYNGNIITRIINDKLETYFQEVEFAFENFRYNKSILEFIKEQYLSNLNKAN